MYQYRSGVTTKPKLDEIPPRMNNEYADRAASHPFGCVQTGMLIALCRNWLRGQDLNLRPSGYEPDELPGCSTPRYQRKPLERFIAQSKSALPACVIRANSQSLSRITGVNRSAVYRPRAPLLWIPAKFQKHLLLPSGSTKAAFSGLL